MDRYRSRQDNVPASEAFWRWLIRAFAMPALLATPARAMGQTPLPASRLDKTAFEKLAPWGLSTNDHDRLGASRGRDLPDLLRRRLGEAAEAPDGVVYPRHEADVQSLLILCAQLDIAAVVGDGGISTSAGAHRALVAIDLGGLSRILSQDRLSGLMDVETGISGAELARQLDAQGLALGRAFDISLGGWIAAADILPDAVRAVRLATPQGPIFLDGGWKHVVAGARPRLGVITSATLCVGPKPAEEDYRAYLFRDFAAGIAVLRQAARAGIALGQVRLGDDGATRFEKALLRRPWDLWQRLFDAWLVLRDFDGGAARLTVGFAGDGAQRQAARKSFETLAKRLGALELGRTGQPPPHPRDPLLDRGAGIDSLRLSTSWSELPLRYAKMRAALKQAMRAHAPVAGAHGLVLAHVSDVRTDGAALTVTWLFPRKLDDDVAQATVLRQTALAIAGKTAPGLELEMGRALKRVLDPQNTLPSDT